GGLHLVANGDSRTGPGWQIDVDPGTEADEAITLAGIQGVTRLCVTKNALGHKPGYLHRCNHVPMGCQHNYCVTFVFQRRLVERRIEKLTGKIIDGLDRPRNGCAVGVDIEYIHE